MSSATLGSTWTAWTRPIRPATAGVVASAVAAGVAFDLVVRHGPPTITGACGLMLLAGALLVTRRVRNVHAVALIAAVPLFAMWLAVRRSEFLLPLDVLASGALLALGASLANGGSVFDLSAPGVVVRAVHAGINGLLAPAYLLRGATRRVPAIIRGVLLAVPVIAVVGALLASADAVFASAVDLDWNEIVTHTVAIAMGAWGMAGLVRVTAVKPAERIDIEAPRLGRTEWTIVLGSLDALLAGFAVARVVALTQGGRHVLETAGLTYAEYARSGFFQLLAAAIVCAAVLLALRPFIEAAHRRTFVVLAEIAIGLVLVVVVQAVQRLFLYERAFGLTIPRLLATAACIWLGLVLVALAAWIAGAGGTRNWFWPAAGAAALAVLFALNAMNPEAFVVHRNVGRASQTVRFDARELNRLGDDAIPAIEAELANLAPEDRAAVVRHVCATVPPSAGSWWEYNGAHDGAIEARNRMCAK